MLLFLHPLFTPSGGAHAFRKRCSGSQRSRAMEDISRHTNDISLYQGSCHERQTQAGRVFRTAFYAWRLASIHHSPSRSSPFHANQPPMSLSLNCRHYRRGTESRVRVRSLCRPWTCPYPRVVPGPCLMCVCVMIPLRRR